jgi:hypothetical protein
VSEFRTKGTGVASFIDVIKERLTPAQLETLEAGLPPESLALFRRRILAVEWIPLAIQFPIGDALLTRVLNGDEAAYVAIVHEASRRDLAGVYKLLIRVMSPEHVAGRASKIFKTYVESGDMRVQPISRENGRARFLIDVDGYAPYPQTWLALRGYIEAPLLITGAKNLQVTLVSHALVGDGAKLQYSVEYDA